MEKYCCSLQFCISITWCISPTNHWNIHDFFLCFYYNDIHFQKNWLVYLRNLITVDLPPPWQITLYCLRQTLLSLKKYSQHGSLITLCIQSDLFDKIHSPVLRDDNFTRSVEIMDGSSYKLKSPNALMACVRDEMSDVWTTFLLCACLEEEQNINGWLH